MPTIKAGPFGSSITKASYTLSGYKVYGQEQVIREDPAYGDYYVDQKKYRELQSCAVAPGDVLMSLVGTAGKVLVVPATAEPGVINPRLIRIRVNKNVIDPTFLAYYLRTTRAQEKLGSLAQGGTMGVLNAATVGSLSVPVPPLNEQAAIVAALFDVDATIVYLNRLINKKQAIKQGMMQRLLTGRSRLPGFSGDWCSTGVGTLGETYGGLTGKSKADFGSGSAKYVPFMRVMTDVVLDYTNLPSVRVGASVL